MHSQCCQQQHPVKLMEPSSSSFILVLELQIVCGVRNIPRLLNLCAIVTSSRRCIGSIISTWLIVIVTKPTRVSPFAMYW